MRTGSQDGRLRPGWLVVLCVVLLLAVGCAPARGYSGVRIENAGEMSDAIRTAMLHRSWQVTLHFDAYTRDDGAMERLADELVEAAFYESDDPCGGDYLRYQSGGCKLSVDVDKALLRYDYAIRLRPQMYTTAQQEAAVDEAVEALLEKWQLTGASDREKIRTVHDYLTETVAYDTVHKHQGGGHIASTAYAALCYHTALCQGYAVAVYRLLKELVVPVRVVTGEARIDGTWERHAWNVVEADGESLQLDVTLDAVQQTDAYFLRSDDCFAIDHRWEK